MEPETPSRLRHEIDSGQTRDKVNYPDPAAAPLGTDEEAAGTPISREAVRQASRQELRPAKRPGPRAGAGLWQFLAWLAATVALFFVTLWLVVSS
jgi:hypothetical protein